MVMVDRIVDRFNQAPIDGHFLIELVFEPGAQLNMTMMQDPSDLIPGDLCRTVSLRFGCIRDVRSTIELKGQPGQVRMHHAQPCSQDQQLKYRRISPAFSANTFLFSLMLSSGTLEVEAEYFDLMTISRAEIYRP
jgi:hypothetical protein